MQMSIRLAIFCIGMMVWSFFLGCSSGGSTPATTNLQLESCPSEGFDGSSRMLWGIWEMQFDPATLEITFKLTRNAQTHYNVTSMLVPAVCSDCISGVINSFDPATGFLDADITLRNPTILSGYDVRGIIHTDNYGHELLNADDWTGLFDFPGGQTINPFKAFAKDEPNRIFAGGAAHTEKFVIHVPNPPQLEAITFVVDASYPGNCDEPYEITNFWQEEIFDTAGSSGNIYIDVRDWQNDVSKVTLVAPEITGEQFTKFTKLGGETWKLLLINTTGAVAGDYKARVIANSGNSGALALYDYINIHISLPNVTFNPVDVTQPFADVAPDDMCIVGDYVYIAGGETGFIIADISDPLEPEWVSRLAVPGWINDLVIAGNYAYLTVCEPESLVIIDISDIFAPSIINTVTIPKASPDLAVSGGYAYVLTELGGG